MRGVFMEIALRDPSPREAGRRCREAADEGPCLHGVDRTFGRGTLRSDANYEPYAGECKIDEARTDAQRGTLMDVDEKSSILRLQVPQAISCRKIHPRFLLCRAQARY